MKGQLDPAIREILWLGHGCPVHGLYGDDGEMQCGRVLPACDFRTAPPEVIAAHAHAARERNLQELRRHVRHVRQDDPNGCLVACLAMVTGAEYLAVRQELTAIGRDDFSGPQGGISEIDAENYLADHGYVWARKYQWYGANRQRPVWPTRPFAPAHIVGVRGAGSHGVVLTEDGRVLDPLHDEPRRLTDYDEVAYMIGVWKRPG